MSTEYYCSVGNVLYFLGKDSKSWHQLSLMSYNGSSFERVSGIHEERLMADSGTYGVWSVTRHGQSAVAVLLTAPGAATARWLMFFPQWKSWFEWESTVWCPINSGTFFAGVDDPNKLFTSSDNVWTDNSVNYQFLTQFRIPSDDDERKIMLECGVQADNAATTLDCAFNDGGDATYGTARPIDMSSQTKRMRKGGNFRQRYVRLSNTSDKAIRLRNFYAVLE
jgi:hypothetical protein